MLTYALTKTGGVSLYEQLYRRVKDDILTGRLATGEKLPSKRALAAHLEVSVITVKNAYEQLMAEGYIYGMEKKGYYVSPVQRPLAAPAHRQEAAPPAEHVWEMDLVTNSIAAEDFPFTVWARLMRQTILEQGTGLLRPMPPQGAPELRRAIAAYLRQFRGMTVDEEQIIIGAGTEQLYNMLVQLLGRDKRYAVEDPGYGKIARIYRSNQAEVVSVPLDGAGLSVSALDEAGADVVHISPSHHYPTGIVMPIARRQELLRWAAQGNDRFILEDDYDSEFRFVGRPIPTLFSVDEAGRVIYLNTFSKTIAPSIRISYMVLPHRLLAAFREKLGFYASTVSGFEQYTLARFMAEGYYGAAVQYAGAASGTGQALRCGGSGLRQDRPHLPEQSGGGGVRAAGRRGAVRIGAGRGRRRRGTHLAQPPLSHRYRHAHRPAAGAAALGGAGE